MRCWGRLLPFLSVFLMSLCPSHLQAQVLATLSGTIRDQSGAAIADANITAKNLDTGISRTGASDRLGEYRLFALPLGEYEIRAEKDGFAQGIRTGIRLVVGQDANVDFNLRIGQVSEKIQVAGDAPFVSATTQDISGLVGERQVKDLPLNGRSYDLLVTLNPGVVNFTSEKTGGNRSLQLHHRKQLLRLGEPPPTESLPVERY
jgi:hypothetical protein